MKFSVRPAARADIYGQWVWYIERGDPHIAERFYSATEESFRSIMTLPLVGAVRSLQNSHLAGLRVWPIGGFEAMRIYYLLRDDSVIVIRILHSKRDWISVLEEENIEELPALGRLT